MKEKLQFRSDAQGLAFFLAEPHRQLSSHRHDELEVNLVLTGEASYLFGNRRVPLVARSMIWLFPGQEHVLIDRSHDFSMWVLVFRPGLVRQCTENSARRILRSRDPGDILCREIAGLQIDGLNWIYEGIADQPNDLEFFNTAIGYALIASWQAFSSSPEWVPSGDVHPAVAKAARVLSTAETPVGLQSLARAAGLSPARLSRLFKQQTGISLTSFRQRQCLERFLKIYKKGARYSLIEAAFLAGLGSYPQFHRVFCQRMGRNPAAYRKSFGASIR